MFVTGIDGFYRNGNCENQKYYVCEKNERGEQTTASTTPNTNVVTTTPSTVTFTAPPPNPNGPCNCGIAQRTTRVIGGIPTEINEYPWMVSRQDGIGHSFSIDNTFHLRSAW